MKAIFLAIVFFSLAFVNNLHALYLVSIGAGCYEVWSDNPCENSNAEFLGIGCPKSSIPMREGDYFKIEKSKIQFRLTLKTVISVEENSDLGKLILKADKNANLKKVKVNAVRVGTTLVPVRKRSSVHF